VRSLWQMLVDGSVQLWTERALLWRR